MTILWGYLITVNIISWAVFGFDKTQAGRGGRRVPEKRLFLLAASGGAAGAWIAMRMFRHKTKHFPFIWGIPALLLLNLICTYLLLRFVS